MVGENRAGADRREGALRDRYRDVRGARQGPDARRPSGHAEAPLRPEDAASCSASTSSARARPRSSTSDRPCSLSAGRSSTSATPSSTIRRWPRRTRWPGSTASTDSETFASVPSRPAILRPKAEGSRTSDGNQTRLTSPPSRLNRVRDPALLPSFGRRLLRVFHRVAGSAALRMTAESRQSSPGSLATLRMTAGMRRGPSLRLRRVRKPVIPRPRPRDPGLDARLVRPAFRTKYSASNRSCCTCPNVHSPRKTVRGPCRR